MIDQSNAKQSVKVPNKQTHIPHTQMIVNMLYVRVMQRYAILCLCNARYSQDLKE